MNDPRTAVGPDILDRIARLEAAIRELQTSLIGSSILGTDQTIKASHDRLDALLGEGVATPDGRLVADFNADMLDGLHADEIGAAWQRPYVAPDADAFSWVNQGGATLSTDYNALYLLAPAASGANLRILEQALPDPPWTCVAYLLPELHGQNFAKCGLVLGNSGNNFKVIFGPGWSTTARVQIQSYNSPGAYVSNYLDAPMMFPYPPWWRIIDDGANRHYATSVSGRHWKHHLTHSRTTQVTANTIGFFAESNNSTWPAGVLLVSWEVLTP